MSFVAPFKRIVHRRALALGNKRRPPNFWWPKLTCVKLAHRDEPAQLQTHINAVGYKRTDTAKPSARSITDGFASEGKRGMRETHIL